MSRWILHIKEWAKKHNKTFGCALSDKRCSESYHKGKDIKSLPTKKTAPLVEKEKAPDPVLKYHQQQAQLLKDLNEIDRKGALKRKKNAKLGEKIHQDRLAKETDADRDIIRLAKEKAPEPLVEKIEKIKKPEKQGTPEYATRKYGNGYGMVKDRFGNYIVYWDDLNDIRGVEDKNKDFINFRKDDLEGENKKHYQPYLDAVHKELNRTGEVADKKYATKLLL